MSVEQFVSDLVFENYRNQRQTYPEIPPERWVRVFGPIAHDYEARYMAELREVAKLSHECPHCCQWCTFDTPEECSHVCEDVAELRDSAKGEA